MNKDLLIKGLLFVSGAAIGSVVTWKLVKTKYEQYANEEIESVKEVFSKRNEQPVDDIQEDVKDESSINKVKDIVKEFNYMQAADLDCDEEPDEDLNRVEEEEDEEEMGGLEVIPPEESWERDYPTITLYYYEGDQVLADEKDRPIKNVEELVVKDFADHFGEYEQDAVLVRNDKLKVYYEILRDYGKHSER